MRTARSTAGDFRAVQCPYAVARNLQITAVPHVFLDAVEVVRLRIALGCPHINDKGKDTV
jgi:hypothetical protein